VAGFFEKVKESHEKGGRLGLLWPLLDAPDTFLRTPAAVTSRAAHVRDWLDSKRFMAMVIVALAPCVFMGAWNAGYQHAKATTGESAGFLTNVLVGFEIILPIIVVSYAVGGAWEALFAVVRRHEINEGFLVTGLLFPLTLPPTTPLWQVAVGISFGVVIGKEVFGGTGMNVFNPALTARAFNFFAFPDKMSGDQVWTETLTWGGWFSRLQEGASWRAASVRPGFVDGYTGATPLLFASKEHGADATSILAGAAEAHPLVDYSWWNCFLGFDSGSIGETSALACLLGAAILVATGVGSWRTMAGVFGGAAAMSLVLNAFAAEGRNPMLSMPFYYHWVVGSCAFAAVYMATDPVSSAWTPVGKWIYGLSIGALAVLIRTVNPAYPEGFMLAVLFLNLFAPLIDHYVVQANIRRRKAAYAR
jgi:Na+-transporting NADH:ubiquinone oxidoreductase subunit B